MDGMTSRKELEASYQLATEHLLRCKDELSYSKNDDDNNETQGELPTSPSFTKLFSLIKEIDEKERYLLELKDQIKHHEYKKEYQSMLKKLSLHKTKDNHKINPLQRWHNEMKCYDGRWKSRDQKFTDDREFFDVKYVEDEESRSLSFGSRYCGRCLRVVIKKSLDDDYIFDSTLGIEALSSEAKEYLCSDKTASAFVHDVVWKGLDRWL